LKVWGLKMEAHERGPKLYIECILKEIKYGESDSYIIDNGEKINFINEGYKTLMSDIDIDYEDTGEGFVYRNSEFSKNILILKIANNGRVPARYIKIDYNIVLYKNLIKYGEDGSVVSYKPVVHKNVSRKLEINYLPPNRNQYIAILYTNSYPKIDIVINSLKCKDNRFISKKTIVYTYKHKEFDYIKDSPHLQRLLGILE